MDLGQEVVCLVAFGQEVVYLVGSVQEIVCLVVFGQELICWVVQKLYVGSGGCMFGCLSGSAGPRCCVVVCLMKLVQWLVLFGQEIVCLMVFGQVVDCLVVFCQNYELGHKLHV